MAKANQAVSAAKANRAGNVYSIGYGSQSGDQVKRRWVAEKCIPLVALGWLLAGAAMVPVVLLFWRG